MLLRVGSKVRLRENCTMGYLPHMTTRLTWTSRSSAFLQASLKNPKIPFAFSKICTVLFVTGHWVSVCEKQSRGCSSLPLKKQRKNCVCLSRGCGGYPYGQKEKELLRHEYFWF